MKPILIVLTAAVLLVLAGCGDDEAAVTAANTPAAASTAVPTPTPEAATPEATEEPDAPEEPAADGTTIAVGDSQFGEILFDGDKQAIYIFENDPKGQTVCYDECAEAWPPVFSKGEPVAGKGVDDSKLGTVKRRDGKRQVTYAGKPLYYYAHEGPGEVRCHNVNLNGGLWWVLGADGVRKD